MLLWCVLPPWNKVIVVTWPVLQHGAHLRNHSFALKCQTCSLFRRVLERCHGWNLVTGSLPEVPPIFVPFPLYLRSTDDCLYQGLSVILCWSRSDEHSLDNLAIIRNCVVTGAWWKRCPETLPSNAFLFGIGLLYCGLRFSRFWWSSGF